MVLAASIAPVAACQNSQTGPEEQARKFAVAVRSANTPVVLSLLDAETRTHVERTAEIATDRVGGRRVIEGSEVFQIVGVDRSFDVASTKLISADESEGRVELSSPSGKTTIVELRYEQADEASGRKAGWRVRLPLPEGMTTLRAKAD